MGLTPTTPTNSLIETYSACATFSIANGSSTFFTLMGSASNTIYVKKISITGTQTTAGTTTVYGTKYSTAPTGGTFSAMTPISHDSTSAAATATLRAYTAMPSGGTSFGIIRGQVWYLPATTGDSADVIYWRFGDNTEEPLCLHGTETLVLGLFGITPTGNKITLWVTWLEK
jgi:hypothetical protein